MTSPITDEAIKIIDAAPNHGPLRPVEYANALPPRAAALARVLRGEQIVKTANDYFWADISAIDAQGRFMRLGWTAAYCGFLAAVLGGVLLYAGSRTSTETLRSNLGLLQSLLLGLSLLCASLLFLLKPYRKWRIQRGDAEAKRLQIFALIMSDRSLSKAGEAPLLPLQLECFRRHLFHDQRDFFARRGPQQRRTVLVWKAFGAFALLLVLASLLPQLMRLDALGLLPEAMRKLIDWLPPDQKPYVLAGLIGGSLQGLLAALTVMSPAQRNAAKYGEMLEQLDNYTDEKLDSVRVEAANENVQAVNTLITQITAELADEGKEWLILQEVLSEMATKQIVQPQKGVL